MYFFAHCKTCTVLDGCYLLDRKKPTQPLHPHCYCGKKHISINKVKKNSYAYMPIIKLSKYIFADNESSKGKNFIFQSWGYSIDDIYELQQTIENQARENYVEGNYELRGLDQYGQRVAIPIDLKGHVFNSGWMLYPEGEIRNTTPFGGWVK